ncbi:Polygalacturonase-1 non-catalytic subunit beta, partial [Mucuna pruriens]
SLFPYLLYYCHSVPKVRLYQADILDPETKANINHGVAICHLDTTAWSPTHGAFLALGSGPGLEEFLPYMPSPPRDEDLRLKVSILKKRVITLKHEVNQECFLRV